MITSKINYSENAEQNRDDKLSLSLDCDVKAYRLISEDGNQVRGDI